MGVVVPGRFLDSAVLSLFLLFLSGLTLWMFGEFYGFLVSPKQNLGKFAVILTKIFGFKRTFDFNLMHIILFALLIAIMSMGEAPKPAEKKKKKKSAVEQEEKEE
uniref:Apicomplexan small protein n=1 Tax=Chromera velia CCMP2878 TaxID=1169474 RepID=A0A0G4H688_9ALVE|mmetsp:Transcript_18465/g.37364  ORF Transcript_18465/g.37364 Transcript_18465/m.37364 type:complete len:105 (-) Transcript_18465:545-859(-)|eukprot:Cvel_24848.t1-p1 / transcript=Cvel_24848.t1 / gene=Cvel_24848 / organism=Chromera_velia_CCMP2878 / gene_product=hypothetical protein / transcript_product=hypothetical protein / location=Cvel_scaffold2742:5813-7559(-) / protein_length=104 / sequence_SO=supercontig / SO=protein_coding / is_pseudo=false